MKTNLLTVLIGFIVIGTMLSLASCTSKGVKRGDERPSALLSTYCHSCHRLPDPKSRTDYEWRTLMENHRKQMSLEEDQYDAILEHLLRANDNSKPDGN